MTSIHRTATPKEVIPGKAPELRAVDCPTGKARSEPSPSSLAHGRLLQSPQSPVLLSRPSTALPLTPGPLGPLQSPASLLYQREGRRWARGNGKDTHLGNSFSYGIVVLRELTWLNRLSFMCDFYWTWDLPGAVRGTKYLTGTDVAFTHPH